MQGGDSELRWKRWEARILALGLLGAMFIDHLGGVPPFPPGETLPVVAVVVGLWLGVEVLIWLAARQGRRPQGVDESRMDGRERRE